MIVKFRLGAILACLFLGQLTATGDPITIDVEPGQTETWETGLDNEAATLVIDNPFGGVVLIGVEGSGDDELPIDNNTLQVRIDGVSNVSNAAATLEIQEYSGKRFKIRVVYRTRGVQERRANLRVAIPPSQLAHFQLSYAHKGSAEVEGLAEEPPNVQRVGIVVDPPNRSNHSIYEDVKTSGGLFFPNSGGADDQCPETLVRQLFQFASD